MKLWMKALIWLGLGGGIGFFAGYQVGYLRNKTEIEQSAVELVNDKRHEIEEKQEAEIRRLEEKLKIANEAVVAIQQYKGLDTEQLPFKEEEEDPEMPMEEPEMPKYPLEEDGEDEEPVVYPEEEEDEEEIQQPHPEDFRPYGITRSEYLANEKGYGHKELDYYTDDAVIFDPKEEEKWTHPEQLLGIGWEARFISIGRPVTEVYIQNDTMGMMYKITRIEGSFAELYEEE